MIFSLFKQALATDYYINQNGDDSWSGKTKSPNSQFNDGPFKTIERAKQAIRDLKQSQKFNDKVIVNIADGVYYLNRPLNYNLMDSGFAGREIVWQADPGARVTISGGMRIPCNKRDEVFWDCSLIELPVTTEFFDVGRIKGNAPKFDLYVNDQKLVLARWPDQDWAHIKSPLDEKSQFVAMEKMPSFSGDIRAAQVHIFPGSDWFDQIVGVEAINQIDNSIKLASPTTYALDKGRRFYIQNLSPLLDAPGEWFFDNNTKTISFISPNGVAPDTVIVSSLPNIVVADDVDYLTFKNLSFQHSTSVPIFIKNSKNIVLDRLDVNNVGGKGIIVKNGKNVQLTNSDIHHTGAEGIDIAGGDKKALQSSGNVIHNNHIHHNGTKLLAHSPSIRLEGVGSKVTHNLLEYGPVTGIILLGNDHLIEKNELRYFCLQSSDCGGFYSGRDWSSRGNIVRYNYIHDILGYGLKSLDLANNKVVYETPGHASGVYLDDGISGFEISGNIIENVGFMGIQLGGGRDNKIVNNYIKTNDYVIFADDRWPNFDWSRNQKLLDDSPYKSSVWQQKYPELSKPMQNRTWPEGNRIERNIMVTSKQNGNSWRYFLPKSSTVIANNLIWSVSGNLGVDYKILEINERVNSAPWQQWINQDIEHGSIIADPCITISNKKMTMCPGSPAKRIGFLPIPTDIGLIQ